ncbi:MAG: hypothetical protein EBS55_06985 [Flavobacteriaceae bacterium]|nr:hypothetical protein [Flavobacteriaceae bacterium]
MKTIIEINGKELDITHATAISSGHGHKKISVSFYDFECNESITLSATTSNMPAFDRADELEGQEKYRALYDIIEMQIQDQLEEFVSPLI